VLFDADLLGYVVASLMFAVIFLLVLLAALPFARLQRRRQERLSRTVPGTTAHGTSVGRLPDEFDAKLDPSRRWVCCS
jgi:hypothetical protein